jgi:hypothetical protein
MIVVADHHRESMVVHIQLGQLVRIVLHLKLDQIKQRLFFNFIKRQCFPLKISAVIKNIQQFEIETMEIKYENIDCA